jgi:hypothetical protein
MVAGHCGFRGAGSEGLLLSPWERARRGPRTRRPLRVHPWTSSGQVLRCWYPMRGDSAGRELPPGHVNRPRPPGVAASPSDHAGGRSHADGRARRASRQARGHRPTRRDGGSALGPAGDRFITMEANLMTRTLDLQHILEQSGLAEDCAFCGPSAGPCFSGVSPRRRAMTAIGAVPAPSSARELTSARRVPAPRRAGCGS